MLIRNVTATLAAIFLVTINHAEAKPSSEFCGDRYCGQYTEQPTYQYVVKRKKHRRHYAKKHYRKHYTKRFEAVADKPKKILVASLGVDEVGFTGESPRPVALLSLAERYLGTNPTGWRSLWCARFIAYIAPATASTLKRMGLNPNWARDYAKLPGSRREGRIGDIVVLSRGRGGHIGILKKFDKNGNPIIISGNHGHKVGEGRYSKSRVLAYVSWNS